MSLSENAAIVVPNSPALGYTPPNTVQEGEQFIEHLSGYGSGTITVDVIDPFTIRDGREYHVVFDTLDNPEDLAFSIRNQELITEILGINTDSTAIASHDRIDSRLVIESSVVNDSTVHDTIFPILVTDVEGSKIYDLSLIHI